MFMKPKETRIIKENAGKETQLRFLDETCAGVKAENGTIRTQGLNYDYWINVIIQRCNDAGATKEEIETILSKYK